MPKKSDWPRSVTVGSVTVKVYCVAHQTNRTGKAYVVAYRTPTGRKTSKFADPAAALEEARLMAGKLAAGKVEAADLTGGDREELHAARGIAGKTPLLAALDEWKAAKALCGDHLLTAAKAWADAHRATTSATLRETVEKFLTAKRRAGVSMKSYEAFLPHLADDMGDMPICSVTAPALESWLHERFGDEETETANPSTFNTGRKRSVALWRWARDNGFVPDTTKTQAELVHPMREDSQKIGIISPATFARILDLVRDEKPDHLAAVVLAGFTGLRRSEIHAQTWEDIDLKRSVLRVTSAKRGTVAYRLVNLCPAAVEWLAACARQETDAATGKTPIAPPWGMDRVRALLREREIPCPENAFRHSFITHRVAESGNIHETALQAGNSPGVVRKYYLELVGKDEGKAWFSVLPGEAREAIPFKAEGAA